MMDWWHLLFLTAIQGLTEFLPVSSSAHLILVPSLTGWEDQGLSFDVAMHFGTLLAVMLYFRDTLKKMIRGCWLRVTTKQTNEDATLAGYVILGSIPVMVAGLALHSVVETSFRSTTVIGVSTIVFGLLLWVGDSLSKGQSQMTMRHALMIGGAQILALIPGTSRSGITMTCALGLGLSRQTAARFSFLLAIPTIGAAMAFESLKLIQTPLTAPWSQYVAAVVFSFGFAWVCIHLFLSWIDKIGMTPFVIYRLALGALLLYLL